MAANTHAIDLEFSEGDYLTAADSASLSVTGNLSIACWAKLETVNQTSFLVAKLNVGANKQSYALALTDDTTGSLLRFRCSANGTNSTTVNSTGQAVSDTTTYHHFGAVYNAAAHTVQFYVDGQAFESAKDAVRTSLHDNDSVLAIGTRSDLDIQFFDGKIDEVVITSDLLTAQEMSDLYDGAYATDILDNVALYWDGNNNLLDRSGNGNTLTNNGGTFTTDVPFANYTATSQIKSVAGVAYASVKKVAGVAIANVKKVVGVE